MKYDLLGIKLDILGDIKIFKVIFVFRWFSGEVDVVIGNWYRKKVLDVIRRV